MKTTYTPYALGGNLVALGGNLWNEMVSRAFRSRDNKTGDLQVAAHVFFEEILPEMQNFMEQKLAANPQLAHIFHLHATTKRNHGTCQPRIERACTACNAKDDLAALLDRGADTVRCKKVLGGGPLPSVACGAPRPCPIHDAGKPQCGTNHVSPAFVGFLPIQNCPVCADTPKGVLPKTTAGEACGTWNDTCENYRNGSGELVGRFCSAIKGHAPTCQFFKKPEGGP